MFTGTVVFPSPLFCESPAHSWSSCRGKLGVKVVFGVERTNDSPGCARVCTHPLPVERAATALEPAALPAASPPPDKWTEEGWLTLETQELEAPVAHLFV